MIRERVLRAIKPGAGTVVDLIRYPDGFIAAYNTARLLGEASDVLVVGDAGGRDAQYLTSIGKRVRQLDLSPQEAVPALVVQSIEDRTPFHDDTFDGVVINEVLEHIYRDVDALGEIRRILKPDGTLIVTVPCSPRQDRPEFHVRIHTPRTIVRLLNAAGFRVESQFCRGVISRLPQRSSSIRTMMLLIQVFAVRMCRYSPLQAALMVNSPLDRLERWMGGHPALVHLQRLSIAYGVIIKARPAPRADARAVQLAAFANTTGRGAVAECSSSMDR